MSEYVTTAWLTCPNCGEEAIESTGTFCQECLCEGGRHDAFGCEGTPGPGWTEGEGGKCPGCGVVLRVVVDDGRAYAEETEA